MKTYYKGKIIGGNPDCVHQMSFSQSGWDFYVTDDGVPCEELQELYNCRLCGAERIDCDVITPDKTLIQIAEDIEDEL